MSTFHPNGVDGATGEYLSPALSASQLAEAAQGKPPSNLDELNKWCKRAATDHLGVKEGVNYRRLDESGWGVIFAYDADPAIKEALHPLLKHRREMAGEFYAEYDGELGYQYDREKGEFESKSKFLARLPHCKGSGKGVSAGPADPKKVPYNLLIVGDPESIPYSFQYQLDVQYAVGRIHFDKLEDYGHYAQSVVDAKTKDPPLPRRAGFFGVRNQDDRATESSSVNLVQPLANALAQRKSDWTCQSLVTPDAGKNDLTKLLNGGPACLFTASHGVGFPNGDPRQRSDQGALICQEWDGPKKWKQKPLTEDHYFSANDVTDSADVRGRVAFFFACYGAGTPHLDDFQNQAYKKRRKIAPHAFVATSTAACTP